jgi:Mg-chelatase subunit ChlD
MADRNQREQFEASLADIIDKSATIELLDLIAGDDELRDERHAAERVVQLLGHAADDYVVDDPVAAPIAVDPILNVGTAKPLTPFEGAGVAQPPAPFQGAAVAATVANSHSAAPAAGGPSGTLATAAGDTTSGSAPTAADATQNAAAPNGGSTQPPTAAAPTRADTATSLLDGQGATPIGPTRVGAPGGGPVRGHVAIWVALGVAAVLGAVILLWSPSAKKLRQSTESMGALSGTVTKVETPSDTSHVETCEGTKGVCRAAKPGVRVESGMLVRTNTRARATLVLDGGESIGLERASAVELSTDRASGIRLNAGTIVVDTAESKKGPLAVAFPLGRADLDRAKCSISGDSSEALIEVTRGRVLVVDTQGHEKAIVAGETGRLRPGRDPSVSHARSVGEVIASNESIGDKIDEGDLTRGLGELRAKKPGETNERNNAVRLARHHVQVHIVGAVAKTEIDEVFTNDTNDVLEGIFRFPLPADAQIERLALEVDGQLVEGAFTDRERASAIWRGGIVQAAPQLRAQIRDEIVWVPGPWRDPALLEWQRGNRFELRIYPIPKQGSRRVVLAYTQVVPGSTGIRRYSYPLPQQTTDLRGVEDFSIDLELRGHDPSYTPTVVGYEGRLAKEPRDVAHFTLAERRFVPHGDLLVDYQLPNGDKDLVAWAHQPAAASENPYVAMLLRPRLPIAGEQAPKAYAFVVDTSRSMFGESLRRASTLAVRMIRELSSDDRVVVLGCDSECRRWPEGLVDGGTSAAQRAETFLRRQTAEGASDLAGSIEAAMDALGRGAGAMKHIVYVGDGTPTAGSTRPVSIAHDVSRTVDALGASVTAVAVGADSDLESLRALARGGRGVVVPYVPGISVARASYAALSATFGPRLVDTRIELPPGIVAVSPERHDTVAAGDELLIVGRLSGPEIRGDVVLRGRVGGRPFEQHYPFDVRPVAGDSNAFVPRLYAARRIADLERRGDNAAKVEAIELSRRFSVASRYTSLLVLESQAMFDAFGLDNRRTSTVWTGEVDDSATSSDATDAETAVEEKSAQPAEGALGGSALGAAGPVPRSSSANPAKKAAPKQELNDPFGSAAIAAAPSPEPNNKAKEDEARARPVAPAAEAPPAYAPRPPSGSGLASRGDPLVSIDDWEREQARSRRRMIPMRRIWERKGEVLPGRTSPAAASHEKVIAAERDLAQNPDRRSATKKLFDLYVQGGYLAKASDLAEQWSQRDPLDVDALVGRADLAARLGDRPLAIRILGSVVDMRPSDYAAQQRLSRLYRWQGQPNRACRFSIALAEFRPGDDKALADALRCTGESGIVELANELKGAATDKVLRAAQQLLEKPSTVDQLSGDLRLTATWQGSSSVDVDLSLIDPDAHRVSWLGAPTRAVITATNVTGYREEGLALRGSKPGEYLLEVTRGSGSGRVEGTVVVTVAGTQRQIPFVLDGDHSVLGVVKIAMVSRLVPLY